MICIYKITNTVNDKLYIGQTRNFDSRKAQHKRDLRKNKHANKHLQNSYDLYGEVFKYEVVEECELKALNRLEAEHMQLYNWDQLYNISTLPYKLSQVVNTPCSLVDIQTKEVLNFKNRYYLNAFLKNTTSYREGVKVGKRWVYTEKCLTPRMVDEIVSNKGAYLYDYDGHLVGKFLSKREAKKYAEIKIFQKCSFKIDGRIKMKYMGDKIPAVEIIWGKNNSKPFYVYDVHLNLVAKGEGLKEYCDKNGFKYNRARQAQKGVLTGWKYGKSTTRNTKWYKEHYWTRGEIDIKKWILENEKVNHIKRVKENIIKNMVLGPEYGWLS